MTLLDTSETLKRILDFLPFAHPLRNLVAELATGTRSPDAGNGSKAAGILDARHADRLGTIGILSRDDFHDENQWALLLWLEQTTGQSRQDASGTPLQAGPPIPPSRRQLVLDLAPGRYKIEYWGVDLCGPIGVEIATGPKLVLGPPEARQIVAAVRKL
jgi:hypothetical protein